MKTIINVLVACFSLIFAIAWSDAAGAEYPTADELPVIEKLPDPFTFFNSDRRVATLEDWQLRREEIKALFQHYIYGKIPPIETHATGEIISSQEMYGGKATLYHAEVKVGPNKEIKCNVRWIQPKGDGPFPLIQYTTYNPSIEKMEFLEKVIDRGYIAAEWYLYEFEARSATDVGQVESAFPDYKTAIVGQWAWSASAVFDYFRKLPQVDPGRIIITGNSKRGKTVLLAAAIDERIPMVVPCCTGIGGAGVFRFNENKQGAYLGDKMLSGDTGLALYSPYLQQFKGKENRLPIDQHMLAALVAPRPILTICGIKDAYDRNVLVQAGHRGAQPVFDWLGVSENNGFRCHPEGHSYYEADWFATLDFADLIWEKKSPASGTKFDEMAYPLIDIMDWKAPDAIK